MVKALFFSHTNIDKSCVQPGSENATCPLYTENPDSVLYGLLRMIPLIFTVLSGKSTEWDLCKSAVFIYNNLIQQRGAKNTFYVALICSDINKIPSPNIFISRFRPSAETHPE